MLVGAGGRTGDSFIPSDAAAVVVLSAAARGPGPRVVGTWCARGLSQPRFDADPHVLIELLGQVKTSACWSGTSPVVLLCASSAKGVEVETDIVRDVLGPEIRVLAPWYLIAEPFGAKELACLALATWLASTRDTTDTLMVSRDLSGGHCAIVVKMRGGT